MKRTTPILMLVLMLLLTAWMMPATAEENPTLLTLYEGPKTMTTSATAKVTANGNDLFVYDVMVNHEHIWNANTQPTTTPMTYFDFEGKVRIEVEMPGLPDKVVSAAVIPQSWGITPEVKDGKVSFMITEPGQYTVVFNDNVNKALHIFANPLETDVIIIDEMSMVDLYLMNALLQAMVPGTRLVIVGDANQLPSIGAGNVLKDMIASGQFKVVELNQIFRQEEGSHIVRNAHLIHQGRPVELDNKSRDFFFLPRNNIQDVLGVLVYLVRDKLPGYVHVKPYDIQILTPMRKGELGVERLNQVMQQYLNPPSDEKKEKEIAFGLFREGDKVMQIKNNYQIEWEMRNSKGFTVDKGVGVFNGDMGIITEINDYTEKITVLFDETREVQYPYASLDELELAYAVTIHKSQGSEYPAVVMPILSGPRVLFHRNLLYTGVTRAKNCLTIVGDRNMLFSMIQNVNEQRRYTTLALRLDQIANESEESGPMDDLGI